ncbi:MAG TPA: hypothetical protein VK878_25265, partial [Candidatus Deferrimicrobiaceae bacterium]|nr:hypothetical protein [Candidatus Deferrimicrobiaceae bacterium]
ALREAGRLGAWGLVDGKRTPRRQASRFLAAALAPGALEGLGPDTPVALALLALADGTGAVERWMDRFGLAPARRETIRRARRDAPGLVARLARARDRAVAYGIMQGVPELTLAWARTLAGGTAARRHLDRHLRSGRHLRALATGDDVGTLGVPPGPAVGELLRALRAAQAAGQVRSRTGALRWLRSAVARGHARGRIAHPTG